MDISSKPNFSAEVNALKTGHKKDDGSLDTKVSETALEKNSLMVDISLNQQIIEATFNTSAAEKPMTILSRETIDHVIASLNEKFEGATFAIDDIQTAYDNELDVSPEATADRIVSMSTAFFGAYREQHSELTEKEAIVSFVKTISRGIDQGFDEAREILDSLGVLDYGDIASNIDKTYELVQTGLKSFLDGFLTPKEELPLPDKDSGLN